MKNKLKFSIIILFSISACSQSYVINMKQETKYPAGRELYYSKCSACHRLYNPDKYTEPEWDSILASMEKKAKLNKKQREEIYNWIIEIKANNASAKVDN